MGGIPARNVLGQGGIGKGGHLGSQLLVEGWGKAWFWTASGRSWREFARVATGSVPAFEAGEADREGADHLGASHAPVEGCQCPLA